MRTYCLWDINFHYVYTCVYLLRLPLEYKLPACVHVALGLLALMHMHAYLGCRLLVFLGVHISLNINFWQQRHSDKGRSPSHEKQHLGGKGIVLGCEKQHCDVRTSSLFVEIKNISE